MTKLPQKPRSHVLETQSENFTKAILPLEWIVERGQSDYGVDLQVEIVIDEQVTGAHFAIQLKGTDSLQVNKNNEAIYTVKTSTLRYFLERTELVVFLLYDAKQNQGYWIWVQDYIRSKLKPGWQKQKSATVRIPLTNKFDPDAIQQIRSRVLKTHDTARWLTAIQTSNNPYFQYRLSTTDDGHQVSVHPRYPGAEKDRPIQLRGTFHFDETPEGQAAFDALQSTFKTGSLSTIDSRFFTGFDVPDALSDLYAHFGELRIETLEIRSVVEGKTFKFKVAALDNKRSVIAEIPYVEFRIVQRGTEEVTCSNYHQDVPLQIEIKARKERPVIISVSTNFNEQNVVHIRDYLLLQSALSHRCWIKVTNLETGLSSQQKLASGSVPAPEEWFFELIKDLVFIQETFNQVIQWPGKITGDEEILVKDVVTILRTGQLIEEVTPGIFTITVDKITAKELAKGGQREYMLRLKAQDYPVEILGIEFLLGPYEAILEKMIATEETRHQLDEIDKLSDDATVKLQFDTTGSKQTLSFDRWPPTDLEDVEIEAF